MKSLTTYITIGATAIGFGLITCAAHLNGKNIGVEEGRQEIYDMQDEHVAELKQRVDVCYQEAGMGQRNPDDCRAAHTNLCEAAVLFDLNHPGLECDRVLTEDRMYDIISQ